MVLVTIPKITYQSILATNVFKVKKHEHTDTFSFGLNFKSKRETEYAMQFGGTEDFSAGLNVAKNILWPRFQFQIRPRI